MVEPPNRNEPGVARDPSSLVAIIEHLRAEGFDAEFRVAGEGAIACAVCGRRSDAGGFAVDRFRRLEGASDPDEMAAVAALRCPSCGAAGTLVLTYGPLAIDEDADVLVRLPEPPPPAPEEVRSEPTTNREE